MKTSIIYPSFCKSELLRITLYRLSKLNIEGEIEVVLVNDGLEDDTFDVIESLGIPFKYLFTGQRNNSGLLISRNPGFVINHGVRHSDSDNIVITGPDVYLVDDDSLVKTIRELRQNPRAMAVPRDVLDDHDGQARTAASKGTITASLLDNMILNKPNDPFMANPYMPYWMGIRREEFETIGGYDEDLTGICSDDNDIVDRLQWNGCQYDFCDFLAIHLWHPKPKPEEVFANPEYHKNIEIRKTKGQTIRRNIGREWGK